MKQIILFAVVALLSLNIIAADIKETREHIKRNFPLERKEQQEPKRERKPVAPQLRAAVTANLLDSIVSIGGNGRYLWKSEYAYDNKGNKTLETVFNNSSLFSMPPW